MKPNLLIIGASGHGKVVADIALKMHRWKNIYFLDDDSTIESSMGIDVLGNTEYAYRKTDDYDIVIGIGDNSIRKQIHYKLEENGATIPTLVHPSAVIGEQVELGAGTIVMANSVINCCTKIGKGCIINTGATVDHDNVIGDFVHISPGAHLAGTVRVGSQSWVGIGSVVSNNIFIEDNCIIGAGAVVVKDLPPNCTAVGIPAKPIKFQDV